MPLLWKEYDPLETRGCGGVCVKITLTFQWLSRRKKSSQHGKCRSEPEEVPQSSTPVPARRADVLGSGGANYWQIESTSDFQCWLSVRLIKAEYCGKLKVQHCVSSVLSQAGDRQIMAKWWLFSVKDVFKENLKYYHFQKLILSSVWQTKRYKAGYGRAGL